MGVGWCRCGGGWGGAGVVGVGWCRCGAGAGVVGGGGGVLPIVYF